MFGRKKRINLDSAHNAIDALQNQFEKAKQATPLTLDLATDRWIIFSDHHKGGRNRADDFRWGERAYNTALAYYNRLKYTLVVLGDAEELWEENPATVIKQYKHTFDLEAQFHQDQRYYRFWGNHDNEWQFQMQVDRHLKDIYGGPPLQVHETKLVNVVDNGQPVGQFFLLHGHQGDIVSDRFAWFSSWFVRNFWKLWQLLTGRSRNTPATNWETREGHNLVMYNWAFRQSRVILIAGHTHRPIFESKTRADQLAEEIKQANENYKAKPTTEHLKKLAELDAKLEWARAQQNEQPGDEGETNRDKPCYFNTGCCCFYDGDITGIEIVDGKICLVRWPNDDKAPLPRALTHVADLRTLFDQCE